MGRKGSCHLMDLVPLPPFLANLCFLVSIFLQGVLEGRVVEILTNILEVRKGDLTIKRRKLLKYFVAGISKPKVTEECMYSKFVNN